MREVTLYEIKQRQVLCTGNVLELRNLYIDNINPVEDSEYIVDQTYEKIQLPIKTYRRSDQEPRYIALSNDVKEILDIEIENTDTNRHLRNRVDNLQKANSSLRFSVEFWESLTWKEHLKICIKKLFNKRTNK